VAPENPRATFLARNGAPEEPFDDLPVRADERLERKPVEESLGVLGASTRCERFSRLDLESARFRERAYGLQAAAVRARDDAVDGMTRQHLGKLPRLGPADPVERA
jgi:hypothetical protein